MILKNIVLALGLSTLLTAAKPENYLLAYFKSNGQDGLHLAESPDGLKWKALNDDRSFLTPAVGGKLMRDPSIVQGPDGMFHMVWTSSWKEKGIGIAHSKDLINWSEQAFLPVMEHEPTTRNSWAPEILWNADEKEYVIYWSSTIPDRFPRTQKSCEKGYDHRTYFTTTKDFKTYTDTKLFYDPGFSVIDPLIRKIDDQWVMILKDETRYPEAKKDLRVATAKSLKGPWKTQDKAFSPNWVEGPMPIEINGQWVVYYDMYRAHRFGAMQTKDFIKWEDISNKITLPKGVRHGCMLKVSDEVIKKLRAH